MTIKKCFQDRFRPVPKVGGFKMDDYWVWGAGAVKGDDGLFHIFASRWDNRLAFSPHWLTNSEIVHAVSAIPEGPYEFKEIALPTRGEEYWDGRVTHNPCIINYGDKYLLFYMGTTYSGDKPTPKKPLTASDPGHPDEQHKVPVQVREAHRNQRIGMAVADSPNGPWERFDKPILEPRSGKWDSCMTTNPTVCVSDNGNITMIYKSVNKLGGFMQLGVCRAKHYSDSFERLTDNPLFDFSHIDDDLEDPCFWWENGKFWLLVKSMEGKIVETPRAGVLFCSNDAISWEQLGSEAAYTRKLLWNDNIVTEQCFLERPQILLQDGRSTHIFFATGTGSEYVGAVKKTWNICVPLRS